MVFCHFLANGVGGREVIGSLRMESFGRIVGGVAGWPNEKEVH